MNGFDVTTTLTPADWHAYQMAFRQRLQPRDRGSRLKSFVLLAAISFVVAMALTTTAVALGERMPLAAFFVGAALSFATVVAVQRRMQARAMPNSDGVVLGSSSLAFHPEGIRLQTQRSQSEYAWSVVEDVTLTTEHLFIWIDRVAAIVVPLRDLPAGFDLKTVVQYILAEVASAGRQIPEPSPSTAGPDMARAGQAAAGLGTASFKDFARAAARLFTLRMADAHALFVSDRTAGSVLVVSLALLIGTDWLLAEPNSEFTPYGLLVCSWYALVALLATWLSSRLSEPHVEIRPLVVLAITLTPIAVVLRLFVGLWLDKPSIAVAILAALYVVFVFERFLRSATLRPQPRALAAILLLIAVSTWMSERYYLSTVLWYPTFDDAAAAEAESGENDFLTRWRASEKILFEQAERIRTAVDQLERPTVLDSAAFFLGFAGMGEQRVFAGEIALADQVIAQKFATTNRAIRLVNDRRDLDILPLASPTALRYTLQALAQKMDRERDVLFLALSSHGSDDGSLSVSNMNLPLEDLTAAQLADALRESGIKWRVIIVSACYSGTFIEPLRDDYTIVITAAATDRTSFGCSDDRDLTYFGEAFYRDSLPTAADLRAAFENAKRLIGEREQLEDIEPSDPQAHFGPALEHHLAEHFARPATDDKITARPQL